jgi:CMP-N-acetylneuraminic acid synthetase
MSIDIKELKVLAVIPARGGSKGLPGKNLRVLRGKPLICYMIKHALASKYIAKVVVSTDDKKIAEIALDYGAEVPFLRPKELALDTTPLNPVLHHAMTYYDSIGWKVDAIISLQPTSPLITPDIIDSTIELFVNTGCDSVVTVSEIKHGHPYRAKKLHDDGKLENFCKEFDGDQFINRQERPPAYAYNGAIYLRKREIVANWNGKGVGLGKDCRGVVIGHEYAVNIDDKFDFKLAEFLLGERLNEDSPL